MLHPDLIVRPVTLTADVESQAGRVRAGDAGLGITMRGKHRVRVGAGWAP